MDYLSDTLNFDW